MSSTDPAARRDTGRSPALRANLPRLLATALMGIALAASPAYVLRPKIGPIPTTALEVVLVIALVAGFAVYWREVPWRNPYLLPGALLLIAATIGVVVTPNRLHALGTWRAYFVEPAAAGLLCGAIAARRGHARILVLGLGVAGSIVAIANIVNTLHAIVAHGFNWVTPPVTLYQTANAIPLYLEPLLAFSLAIVRFSDDRWERLGGAIFSVVGALAIVLSFSRAGWVTLVVLVIFVAASTRLRWWLIGVVVVVGGGAFALSKRVRDRVLVEFHPGPLNTIGSRISLWESTLTMLRHKPLFGAGLDGFQQTVAQYKVASYGEDLIYPHNLFLDFWTETGLLGLAAIVSLGVQIVRGAIRGLRAVDRPWTRAMSLGLLGLAVVFVVHGMVDVPYFKNDQALAFWALLGIQLGSLGVSRRAA
ncbi:MAG: O-antigen ligase family protein [Candidatus Dormiibacterota bacterium]